MIQPEEALSVTQASSLEFDNRVWGQSASHSKCPFASLHPQYSFPHDLAGRSGWWREIWLFQVHGPILDQSYSPQPTNNCQNPTLTRLRIQSRYMVVMKIPSPPCSFPIQVSGDKLSCTYKGFEYSKSSEKLINSSLAAWDFSWF